MQINYLSSTALKLGTKALNKSKPSRNMARTPVVLNVYDMYWLNEYISPIGLGVYHSGIEVYGKGRHTQKYIPQTISFANNFFLSEYAFGGHPFDCTGIFDMDPKSVEELGEGFTFKETVVLGFTDFRESEISALTETLGKAYVGSSYHLIKKNCNHFTSEFSKLICGKDIPNWVNRLATLGTRFPFLAACVPKAWLTPDTNMAFNDYVDLNEWEEIDYPKPQSDFENYRLQTSNQTEPLLTLTEMLAQGEDNSALDKDDSCNNEMVSNVIKDMTKVNLSESNPHQSSSDLAISRTPPQHSANDQITCL